MKLDALLKMFKQVISGNWNSLVIYYKAFEVVCCLFMTLLDKLLFKGL